MFPFGAVTAATAAMIRKNKEDNKKIRYLPPKEKERYVENIIVVYDDNKCTSIPKGIAINVIEDGCELNFKNCTSEDIVHAIECLTKYAKDRDMLGG